ncbi:NFATC2-interacting protein [Anabas testudineus]|uniref:NFATC2-interacting protein n=1 Tax=Anabas testudineus TaxID=64144 RepID=UPI000E45745D|nr:NFATC2-interacting protein [Anabas testudineus]
MAEAGSKGEVQAVNPPPKRRRILDPSAIVPVPVYSNKVKSSLQLKPMAPVFTEKEKTEDVADDSLLSEFSSKETTAAVVNLSDSDEDEEECPESKHQQQKEPETIRCPSPPPPQSPVQKQSRQVKQKLSEIDRELRAVNSLLSPEPQNRTRSRSRHAQDHSSPMLEEEQDDEDVIIVSPDSGSQSLLYSPSVREIPLKIRCRTDIHKIPVLSSTPLSDVVTQLSVTLNVPPSRLLLLREEEELPTHSTISELGLGIADIIECVVMAAEDKSGANDGSSSNITVKLQGKDKDSSQEFSLHKDATLGPIFYQYLSKMSPSAQRKVRFHFDGSKVTHSQTPAELNMEDGDIIEVWT